MWTQKSCSGILGILGPPQFGGVLPSAETCCCHPRGKPVTCGTVETKSCDSLASGHEIEANQRSVGQRAIPWRPCANRFCLALPRCLHQNRCQIWLPNFNLWCANPLQEVWQSCGGTSTVPLLWSLCPGKSLAGTLVNRPFGFLRTHLSAMKLPCFHVLQFLLRRVTFRLF